MVAAGIDTIVGILFTENVIFKIAFAVTYLAVAGICIQAVRMPICDLIRQGYETTMRITCVVTFILIGSSCFSAVFLDVSGGVWLEHMLTSLPGDGPALIWFGVMLCVKMQTSFLHPLFGFALFDLRGSRRTR